MTSAAKIFDVGSIKTDCDLNNVSFFPGCEPKRVALHTNGTVDPITDLNDIEKIKSYLYEHKRYRDLCGFIVGINIGLRAGDLLTLRISDVVGENGNGTLRLQEQKTGKNKTLKFNKSAIEAVKAYCDNESIPYNSDRYIFESQKGSHIEVNTWRDILCNISKELSLPYRIGTHSLRKTFGYHMFKMNQCTPEILAYLQDIFNHSSSAITLRYIGITQEKKNEFYDNLNL